MDLLGLGFGGGGGGGSKEFGSSTATAATGDSGVAPSNTALYIVAGLAGVALLAGVLLVVALVGGGKR